MSGGGSIKAPKAIGISIKVYVGAHGDSGPIRRGCRTLTGLVYTVYSGGTITCCSTSFLYKYNPTNAAKMCGTERQTLLTLSFKSRR